MQIEAAVGFGAPVKRQAVAHTETGAKRTGAKSETDVSTHVELLACWHEAIGSDQSVIMAGTKFERLYVGEVGSGQRDPRRKISIQSYRVAEKRNISAAVNRARGKHGCTSNDNRVVARAALKCELAIRLGAAVEGDKICRAKRARIDRQRLARGNGRIGAG